MCHSFIWRSKGSREVRLGRVSRQVRLCYLEGTRDQFWGETLGNDMEYVPQRNLTCVSTKMLRNLYTQSLQPLLEVSSGGYGHSGLSWAWAEHPSKATFNQEIQILGRSTLHVVMGWVNVCFSPPFYFIKEEQEEEGASKGKKAKKKKERKKNSGRGKEMKICVHHLFSTCYV